MFVLPVRVTPVEAPRIEPADVVLSGVRHASGVMGAGWCHRGSLCLRVSQGGCPVSLSVSLEDGAARLALLEEELKEARMVNSRLQHKLADRGGMLAEDLESSRVEVADARTRAAAASSLWASQLKECRAALDTMKQRATRLEFEAEHERKLRFMAEGRAEDAKLKFERLRWARACSD